MQQSGTFGQVSDQGLNHSICGFKMEVLNVKQEQSFIWVNYGAVEAWGWKIRSKLVKWKTVSVLLGKRWISFIFFFLHDKIMESLC